MIKEKYTNITNSTNASIVENKVVSFDKINHIETSFRVHQDGFVGIHYQQGKIEDEEGFKKAEINLKLKRPYPFELEKGVRQEALLALTSLGYSATEATSVLSGIEITPESDVEEILKLALKNMAFI